MGEQEIDARSDIYALGLRAVRDARRRAAVHRADGAGDRGARHDGGPAPPRDAAAHDSAARRGGGDHGAGETPGRPVRQRGGVRGRARGGGAIRGTVPVRAAAGSRHRPWRVPLSIGGGVLAVLALFFASRAVTRRAPPPSISRHWSIVLPDSAPVAFLGGSTLGVGTLALAVSPDGTTLVYVARRGTSTQLFRRRLDESSVSPIAGTDGAYDPFFSPDGQWIGFFVGAELRKVPLAGGQPVTLAQLSEPYGASWPENGRILVAPREATTLGWVPASGGTIRLIRLPPGTMAAAPSVLPGGRQALASVWFPSTVPGMGVVDLATGTMLALTTDGPVRADTADASRIFEGRDPSTPRLRAHRLYDGRATHGRALRPGHSTDARTARRDGERHPDRGVAAGAVRSDTWTYPDLCRGRVCLRREARLGGFRGPPYTLLFPTRSYGTFDLSPDGRRVVVMLYPPAAGPEVWVLDLDRRQSIKLATQGIPSVPRWWPDGRRVVFTERSPHPPYRFATVRQFPGSAGPRDTLLNEWSVNDLSSDTTKPELS